MEPESLLPCVHNCQPLDHIVSQMNALHTPRPWSRCIFIFLRLGLPGEFLFSGFPEHLEVIPILFDEEWD